MIFRTIIKKGGLKVENALKVILNASKYRRAKENYPKAAMDTQSYSVATVSTRRARSVGNRQKRLSLVAEGGFTYKGYMMSREASCLRLGAPLQ